MSLISWIGKDKDPMCYTNLPNKECTFLPGSNEVEINVPRRIIQFLTEPYEMLVIEFGQTIIDNFEEFKGEVRFPCLLNCYDDVNWWDEDACLIDGDVNNWDDVVVKLMELVNGEHGL